VETKANYIAVGSFVLVLLAGIVGFILWFSQYDFGLKTSLYDIYFDGSVSGLRVNEDVKFHGIQIGEIKEIDVDKKNFNRVRVRVSVKEPSLIREDVYAIIEAQGLTGLTYIQLQGGSKQSPKLKAKEGERYPVIKSQPSKIEMLFSNAPLVLSSLYDLSEQMNDMFDKENRDRFREVLRNLTDITDKLNKGANSLDVMMSELRGTLSSFGETIKTVGKMSSSLDKASVQIEGLIKENRANLKNFTDTGLQDLNRVLKKAKGMVDQISSLTEQFDKSPAAFLNKSTDVGYELK